MFSAMPANKTKRSGRRNQSITGIIILTITLSAVLITAASGIIMLLSNDMSKYSTLINNTGRIRGGIQRVAKMEISYSRDDSLIFKIDELIQGALKIDKNRFIRFLNFNDFSSLLLRIDEKWYFLKIDIARYRNHEIDASVLIAESEELWLLSDEIVTRVEKSSKFNVVLYYIISIFSAFAIIIIAIALTAAKIFIKDRIEYQADHDQLTGSYNRHFFDRIFTMECGISSRNGRKLSLMMFDIDKFKIINDTYGHETGDTILKSVARTIEKSGRESDMAARYGGEEFIVLSIGENAESAAVFAERIRNAVEKLTFTCGAHITVSAGIAEFDKNMKCRDLIRAADKALYRAKDNGRNRVEIYKI